MQTQYKFVHFKLIEQKPKKTVVYQCCNNRSGSELGLVKWYPAWRQYCYFPTIQAVYRIGCLSDISDFIEHLKHARRS